MKLFSNKLNWERFPALFIFGSILSGALCSMGMIYPILFAFTHKKRSFVLGYILLSATTAIFFIQQKKPPLCRKDFVEAYITPKVLKRSNGKLYLSANIPILKTASLEEFENLSCIIPIEGEHRPLFDQDFIVTGTIKRSPYGYFLQPASWEKVSLTFSLAELRYRCKRGAEKIIHKHTLDNDVRGYFSSLVTGDVSDLFIKERFKAVGLLHTLAISGFHFGWVIFVLSVPLSLIFPKKWSLIVLLFFAWVYLLFLGSSASVSRAFLAITIYLVSILISTVALPLNALGLAGVISFLISPYCLFELSFSLSYLATFAILTLYPLISEITGLFCRKRDQKTLLLMPFFDKIAYFVLRMLLLGGVLSMVIQIVLLPLLIGYFPFFSLWGIFYNMYFPLSMIPTLVLLILSFIFPPLWRVNEMYSKPFLESVLYGNGFASLLVKLPGVHPQILSGVCCLLIFLCLRQEGIYHEENLDLQDQ